MNSNIKKFIDENRRIIDNEDWETVYTQLSTQTEGETIFSGFCGEFTTMLLEIGIDPSDKMSYIPEGYLSGQAISQYVVKGNCKQVRRGAFARCSELTTLILLEGVESIQSKCILMCPKLQKLVLPNTLKQIGYGNMQLCGSLYEIEYNGTQQEWRSLMGVYWIEPMIDIKCIDGLIHRK